MRDRSTPAWAAGLSVAFAFGAACCVVAVLVFPVFLIDLVAMKGQEILAYLLALGALAPIFGIVVFEVGLARALSGYRHMRDRDAAFGRALVAGLATGGLAFLHPLVALPILVGVALCWVILFPMSRFLADETAWSFLPQEAASFLAGRDSRALQLANAEAQPNALAETLMRAIAWAVLIAAFATGSWLVAREVLALPAVPAVALISFWALGAFARAFRQASRLDPEYAGRADEVVLLPGPGLTEAEEPHPGLCVHRLSVRRPGGGNLLSDISFSVEPGTIVGLCGDGFAGKSLLLKALAAPRDLAGLVVEGHVSIDQDALWLRDGRDRETRVVHLPSQPLCVPGDGQNNLTCLLGGQDSARARRLLKSLVYTSDTVDHICGIGEASDLSATELKSLSFARALFLRPALYLVDRPEDGSTDTLLQAFGSRLQDEARLGGIILMATNDRHMLSICDKLLMMQGGRLVELASAADINARMSAGWARFVAERDLDREEALDAWICAQFRRDGDDANRRRVCLVANEMLALACSRQGQAQGPVEVGSSVSFEFRHFKGHCVLRLELGSDTLSSGAMQQARAAATAGASARSLSPLARIIEKAVSVELTDEDGESFLEVTIETYDPRVKTASRVSGHADHHP